MRWKLVRSLFTFVLFKLHFIRNIQHQQHHWQGAFHVLPLELRIFFKLMAKNPSKLSLNLGAVSFQGCVWKSIASQWHNKAVIMLPRNDFLFSSRLQRPRFWVKWLWNRNMADAEHWNIDLGMIWLSVMCWWKVKLEMRRQHFRLIPVQHQ